MRYAIALIGVLVLSAQAADAPAPLRGYDASDSAQEVQWEQKFRAIPDETRLRANMQRLSARPHHVGSPYDKDNAEWLLKQLQSWGLDAKIENFDTLFPTPKERLVEMVSSR